MTQNAISGITWEVIVKSLLGRLDIPSREEIDMINRRLDRLEKQILGKSPASVKEAAAGAGKKAVIASDVVLDIIARHPVGADFKLIKAETGYNDKKLRNIIFRLDKLDRVQRVRRGVYKKV